MASFINPTPPQNMRVWRIKLDERTAEYSAWESETALHRFFLDLKEESKQSIPTEGEEVKLGVISLTYLGKEQKDAPKPKKAKTPAKETTPK